MKIVKIEPEGNRGKNFIITDENDDTYKISAEVYFRRGLKIEEEIDESELKELIYEDSILKARNRAFSMLDIKMRTVKEVKDKLKSLDFENEIIDKVIGDIEKLGYLDDVDYAKKFINEKIKVYGKHKIINDLKNKGIDKDIISNVMNDDIDDEEYASCYYTALKKYPGLKGRTDDDSVLRDKMYRFLISRGFGYNVIKKAYDAVVEQTKEDV